MFDINEIRKRAQAASDAASRQLNESMEKSRKITEQMQEDMEAAQAAREAGQQQDAEQAAAQQRQVEILGQMFSPDVMAQMAATEEMIQKAVDEKVAEAAALGVEGMMNQFFGDDTALVAAALETLAMEEEDPELDQALDCVSKGRPPVGAVWHPALRHHLPPQRPPVGRYGCGRTHPGDGTADRLLGAPLLGHQRKRRTIGHHPVFGGGGVCPALPPVWRGVLPRSADGGVRR